MAASPLQSALLSQLGGPTALHPQVVAALSGLSTPIAVACSGGPDSVAAALVLRALAPAAPLTLLHFDHCLRGAESTADAAFVRELAATIGADYREGVWQHGAQADTNNITETDARTARMAFLHQWEHQHIVFGHHADDAAETLLMRLVRGATLEGLIAPRPISQVGAHTHLRPFIRLRKAALVAALDSLGIAYRIDSSNLATHYLRNRIRHQLLPLWQSLYPADRDIIAGIIASQDHLRGSYEREYDDNTPAPAPTSTTTPATYARVSLPIGATLCLPCGGVLSATLVNTPSLDTLRTQSSPLSCVYIAHSAAPLSVAPWAPGDRYTPLGAPGSRKVKSILNETVGYLPSATRALWPMVYDSWGVPLWLPGARITATAAVPTAESHCLQLRFMPPLASSTSDDLLS